ncbi:CRISPR-associated helicase Cas3' [Streptomyces sp. NPDC000941]
MVEELSCLFAHSANGSGRRHLLVDHLRAVATLAREFALPFGGGDLAFWLGLLHDAGKAAEEWQRRLLVVEGTKETVGIDHKAAGTRLLINDLGFDVFALPVHGHHGGLVSPGELEQYLASPERDLVAEEQAAKRLKAALPELHNPPPMRWPTIAGDVLGGELLTRMLFSALVDADHLDTQVHVGKRREYVGAAIGMAELLDRFEGSRQAMLAQRDVPGPVDPLRAEVYEACVKAAVLPPGFFKLAAPTGLGKTMASAGFALHHAAQHGLRRVVVAVPFISITEQNADVYRRLLRSTVRDAVLLEHHSSVDLDRPGGRWQRLAAENWDAPFVVTTTVQLLQSLHSRRPSAMRKLHRLAGSVLVLDEIQALPVHLLIPILTMLRQLVDHFGVTVLLASATQPEFWDLAPLREVAPVEILPDPAELQARVRRIRPMRYRWWTEPRPTLEQVAREAVGHSQVLAVVNTVDHARRFFTAAERHAPRGVVVRHLSTRMCQEHRRATLAEVERLLRKGQAVVLVSTQLIEAGVDVDFPVVYRALAPAENILQAAGRANREGRRSEGGLVVIFSPYEQGMPPSYGLPVAETRRLFGPGRPAPDDLGSLARYFRQYYGMLPRTAMGADLITAREAWNFPAVAEGFRMIEDDGVPVVVHYQRPGSDEVPISAWLERLRGHPADGFRLLRRLQPYTVSLRANLLDKPEVSSCLRPVLGDLYEWTGLYDDQLGLHIPTHEDTP